MRVLTFIIIVLANESLIKGNSAVTKMDKLKALLLGDVSIRQFISILSIHSNKYNNDIYLIIFLFITIALLIMNMFLYTTKILSNLFRFLFFNVSIFEINLIINHVLTRNIDKSSKFELVSAHSWINKEVTSFWCRFHLKTH